MVLTCTVLLYYCGIQKKKELRSTFFLGAEQTTPTSFPGCTILKHNVLHTIWVLNTRRKALMQIQACSQCIQRAPALQTPPTSWMSSLFFREIGVKVGLKVLLDFISTNLSGSNQGILMSLNYCNLNQSQSLGRKLHPCLKVYRWNEKEKHSRILK